MKKKIIGFTLIEVSFFIALTGLLFVAIIAGTQNSIWQQQYNDSVQKYAGFLRSVYSQASNTQGLNGGRSDKAIYGKLITFGQRFDFEGNDIAEGDQKIFVYDVIGDANYKGGTGSINEVLSNLGANVLIEGYDNGVTTAGIADSFSPAWGSVIEDVDGDLYKGSILVVRHPKSGMLNTLVSSEVIEVNKKLQDAESYDQVANLLTGVLSLSNDNVNAFKTQTTDFCLNPNGYNNKSTLRRDIRIVDNARNASGVEIIDLSSDSDINKCAKQ